MPTTPFVRHPLARALLALCLLQAAQAAQAQTSAAAAPACPPPIEERLPGLNAYTDAVLTPGAALPPIKPEDLQALGTYLDEQRRLDWAGRCKYREANAALAARPTVVFLGDSITENWARADPALFSKGVVNRGIGGQVTRQMLGRLRQDVLDLRPQVLHFNGGINDLAQGVPVQEIHDNILSIVELAQAHGIRVVIGSLLPVSQFPLQPDSRPAADVVRMNVWLRDLAAQRHLGYVDYHGLLADAALGLPASLGNDGLHPHREGYARMAPLARKAIDAALRRR